MKSEFPGKFGFLSGAAAAFLIVVCAAYASAITAVLYAGRSLSAGEIIVLGSAGIAYLVTGTYGFARCRQSGSLTATIIYFVVQLALATTMILLRGSAGELSMILLPLAGQSALLAPLRVMVPICALIYVTLVMPLLTRGRWVGALAVAIVYGVGIVFVVAFTRMAASEREARLALAAANQQLREHAAHVKELATTEERNRLAREIHDSLGHYLTVVNVQIEAARAILAQDRPRALNHLAQAQTLTQEGLAEVRRSVAALRATPVASLPLTDALSKLIEQWSAADVSVALTVIGAPRPLTPQTEFTLYRAAQEGLTNAGKHAQATSIYLTMDYSDDQTVRLKIEDDGRGSADSQGGFGLLGVRERVQLLGGMTRVRTAGDQGFTLEVELPA
jgi:signal transduction histidine kinase